MLFLLGAVILSCMHLYTTLIVICCYSHKHGAIVDATGKEDRLSDYHQSLGQKEEFQFHI